MKLNTKFVFLITSFSAAMLLMTGIILSTFSMQRNMQKYEYKTLQMQKLLQELTLYPAKVMTSNGINLNYIVSDWTDICTTTSDMMKSLTDPDGIKFLDEQERVYVESLKRLWTLVESQINTVTSAVIEFSEMPFTDLEKVSVKTSSALVVITYLSDSDERKTQFLYIVQKLTQEAVSIQTTSISFEQVLSKLNESITARCEALFRFFAMVNIAGTVLAAIIVYIISMIVTGAVTKRVKKLQQISVQLAEKDFSASIDSSRFGSDEIYVLAASLEETVADLSYFLEAVKQSSRQNVLFGENISNAAANTASATHEISSNIESLRRQFDDIEDAVKRSVASLNKMSLSVTGLIKDNEAQSAAIKESDAASAKMAAFVERIRQMAEENCESAEDMQEVVSFGDQKIEASNVMLREVSNQLTGIAEIVTIINAIAEQTNILSMNAAIESAHAGESGKGFAVVAEEIRGLAESTSENSRRISDALFSITTRMREAAESSDHAAQSFADVTGKSNAIHESLNQILENINDAADAASQVAAYSQRIAVASEKMNNEYDELNEERNVVSSEMEHLEDVFALSRTGLDEIKIGSEDIVNRMVEVTQMSTQSREKMAELSEDLSQFKTQRLEDVQEPADGAASDGTAAGEPVVITEQDDVEYINNTSEESDGQLPAAAAADTDEALPVPDSVASSDEPAASEEVIDDFDKFFGGTSDK